MDDAAPRFDGVFHSDATCRLEAWYVGVLLLRARHQLRDVLAGTDSSFMLGTGGAKR